MLALVWAQEREPVQEPVQEPVWALVLEPEPGLVLEPEQEPGPVLEPVPEREPEVGLPPAAARRRWPEPARRVRPGWGRYRSWHRGRDRFATALRKRKLARAAVHWPWW